MTERRQRSGSCLCGAVRIVAKVGTSVGACHCSMCRTWGGGPLLAVDCGTDATFEGEGSIRTYRSSEWAERGFCSTCGSHLFYRLVATGQCMVPPGLFHSEEGLTFDHQVFIDEKPPYYGFANETHDMTGAEVFAAYGGGSD